MLRLNIDLSRIKSVRMHNKISNYTFESGPDIQRDKVFVFHCIKCYRPPVRCFLSRPAVWDENKTKPETSENLFLIITIVGNFEKRSFSKMIE